MNNAEKRRYFYMFEDRGLLSYSRAKKDGKYVFEWGPTSKLKKISESHPHISKLMAQEKYLEALNEINMVLYSYK